MDLHRCNFVDYTPHTITSLAFSLPSSSEPLNVLKVNKLRLAVGRSNGDIEIWNPRFNWSHELTLSGSRGRSIEGLVWSSLDSESPRLFSIGGSTYITEWDLTTRKPKTNYDCNAGVIWSIDINNKGNKLAVGCDDGSVVIVDISGGFGSLEHELICQRQTLRVLSLKWFESSMLIGGCSDARVRVWSTDVEAKGRLLNTMRVDKSKTEGTLVWSVMVLNNKRQIVSGDSTGSIKFWDLDNFSLLQTYKVHEADVLCLTKDLKEEKIFTAGVDRKIHQFDLITSNKNKISKWIHSCNRLLHSNDIRSLATFESKHHNFIVSGGVERSIVIQSITDFQDGKYKKLAIGEQHSNVFVHPLLKLIVMWQDQTVKIWRVKAGESHKLVAKLTLADDENITSVTMNDDATLLAVSRLTSVKLFSLTESKSKLLISKIRDEQFDNSVEGAKKVQFYSENKFILLTPEDELYKYSIDADTSKVTLEGEIELLDTQSSSSNTTATYPLSYSHSIKDLVISDDAQIIGISRFNGSIEIVPLLSTNLDPYVLTKLLAAPQVIKFNLNASLLAINEENKLYEYVTKKSNNSKQKTTSLLTPWSQRNSEFLPKQYSALDGKAQGIFIDDEKRVWLYGSTWLAFFDLALNIPDHKANITKKRNRDGLSIQTNNQEEVDDVNDDNFEEQNDLETDLQKSEFERSRKFNNNNTYREKSKKPFWITTKYRPILKVDGFGDHEIVVIERPAYAVPTTAAFDLPRIRI